MMMTERGAEVAVEDSSFDLPPGICCTVTCVDSFFAAPFYICCCYFIAAGFKNPCAPIYMGTELMACSHFQLR